MTTQLSKSDALVIIKNSILARLGEGLSLFRITMLDGFPTYQHIVKMAQKDEDFDNALKCARVASGYRAADRANELVNKLLDGELYIDEPKYIAPIFSHLHWQAEREARETYGQQLEVKHKHDVNIRTSFLIARTKQSVDDGEVIEIDSTMQPAQLGDGDDNSWMG